MQRRTQLTRNLLPLLEERVAGCNLCAKQRAQVPVEEVCERLRFTLAETRRATKSFICPSCEAGPHLYETVAEWEPDEWADLLRRRRWQKLYASTLQSLVKHLEKTPGLALLHPAGRDLQAAVRRARISTVEDSRWWRACCAGNLVPPLASRFLPADPHRVSIPPGRFNHAGQVALYAADSPDTAAAEVLGESEGDVWIAGLAFRRPLRLLDAGIRILGEGEPQGLLLAGLNVSAPRHVSDKAPREWIITRLIADFVRQRPSVDGILYASSRLLPFAKNIVLVKSVPTEVSTLPARYHWAWKYFGPPFAAIRSHLKAELMQ
jgi:RES domain-containing protein